MLVSSATSVNLSIVGASSSIEVIKIGGAQGAAGQGVVAGGTVGQVLGKASAADYDTAWVDQTGGGTGFLPLTGGTLTGRLTMDITGNNEGLVINHPGGTSESAAHFFTSTTGVQKAVQASRSGQSTAFFSIEGRLGGSNTQPALPSAAALERETRSCTGTRPTTGRPRTFSPLRVIRLPGCR